MSGNKKVLLGATLIGIGVLIYTATKSTATPNSIKLKKGWNEVTYKGKSQKVEMAFKSIETYILIVYYWSGLYGQWMQLVSGNFVEPSMLLNIDVRQDCTWTF